MKKKLLTFVFALLVATSCFARTYGNDCLGFWCTIDVDLSHNNGGDLVFTIPVPPEGIILSLPNEFNTVGPIVEGPASPYLLNNLGNTVDLHLKRSQLLVEYETNPTECVLELFVNKKVNDFGIPITDSHQTFNTGINQCYYYIRLLLTM